VTIEGPLKELHIHDVFQLLDLGRKTGELVVTSDLRQNAGMVYFEGGAVVGAEIKSNPHPLGALLIRSGKVSAEDVSRALDMQANRDGQRLGELLVEIGAIARPELDRQISDQVEEVIFELMSWSEGYFSFEETEVGGSTAEAHYRIPTESLLMEAARRIDEWSRFESRIPHLGVIPTLNAGNGGGPAVIDLLPDEWALLSAVDGEADVRGVANRLGRSEFEVAKILFGLASAGIIVIEDPKVAPPNTEEGDLAVLVARTEDHLAVADVTAAEMTARDAIAAYPDDGFAFLILGRVLLAAHRFGEAVEALRDAVELDGQSATSYRLLGVALAGAGEFSEAQVMWQQWLELPGRNPHEKGHTEAVTRYLEAAGVLEEAMRERHE
jgi:tetratricopeptide (TPR) repeat protein